VLGEEPCTEGVVRLGTSLLQCTLASMRLASVATHKT